MKIVHYKYFMKMNLNTINFKKAILFGNGN